MTQFAVVPFHMRRKAEGSVSGDRKRKGYAAAEEKQRCDASFISGSSDFSERKAEKKEGRNKVEFIL